MLFSELYKIMVNKVTFVGFGGAIAPIAPLVMFQLVDGYYNKSFEWLTNKQVPG